jgi:predicted dehydrogenase
LKIGIIGVGTIALAGHIPSIQQTGAAELVAVLSRDKQKATDILTERGLDEALIYDDIQSFVNDSSIQLVVISSPDGLHYEQAKACLEAGKHVLVEKPMTLEVIEAEELARIANGKGLKLAISFHLRSHDGHQLLKERISSGVLGEVRHIRVIWAWPAVDASNWRANSELTKWWSLSAVGSHCLDLARWFVDDFGDWQKTSCVVANNVWQGPNDETALVSGQLEGGITVDVVSSVQFGPFNKVEIFGSKASAICSGTLGREGSGVINVGDETVEFRPESPFAKQLQNIISAIENGSPLNAGVEAGLRSVKDLNLVLEVKL